MSTQSDIKAINTAAAEADAVMEKMDALFGKAAELNGAGDYVAGGAKMLQGHLLLGAASMKLASVARMAVTALARATDDTPVKPPVGPKPPATKSTGFPMDVLVGNQVYTLNAPINPDWLPAVTDRVFGGQFSEPRRLADPSNSDGTVPYRSPAGYPLQYAIGRGPNGENVFVKKPDGTFMAGVVFDGTSHDNDAAIPAYLAAVLERDANLKEWQASVDVRGVGFPDWTTEKTDEVMKDFDARAAKGEAYAYYHITALEHYGLQNRGMTRHAINLLTNKHNGGAPPA